MDSEERLKSRVLLRFLNNSYVIRSSPMSVPWVVKSRRYTFLTNSITPTQKKKFLNSTLIRYHLVIMPSVSRKHHTPILERVQKTQDSLEQRFLLPFQSDLHTILRIHTEIGSWDMCISIVTIRRKKRQLLTQQKREKSTKISTKHLKHTYQDLLLKRNEETSLSVTFTRNS